MLRRSLFVLALSLVLVHGVNACSDELNPQPLPPADPDKNAEPGGAADVPGGNGSTGASSSSSSSSSSGGSSGAMPGTEDAGADADSALDAGGDT